MRLSIVSLTALMACGGISTEGSEDGGGATVDATAGDADPTPMDAMVQSRCDPTADFATIVSPAGLNDDEGRQDEDAFLTADELTIYFSTRRGEEVVSWDIYTASRTSRDDPFDGPMKLGEVNTDREERQPTVSADGLILYATTDENGFEVSVAERRATDVPFGPLRRVALLNSGLNSGSPYMLPNGRIYFSSDHDPGAPTVPGIDTIYSTRRTDVGIEDPEPVLGEDIGPGPKPKDPKMPVLDAMHPVVSTDELTMFFASNREGSLDIWVTTRESVGAEFGPSKKVVRLATERNEYPGWISADGCVLYFTRELEPENGLAYDILMATRGGGEDAM